MLGIVNARAQSFQEGTNVLGVGFGIGGNYGIGFTGSGVKQSPAIALHFDHGMGDLGPGIWGLGGFLGYKSYGYEYDNIWLNGNYQILLQVDLCGRWGARNMALQRMA